jgi:FkbH-like protein
MMASRLALIGPFSWQLLTPALAAAIRSYGLATEVAAYGFGQDAAVWSLGDADFNTNPPQGAIVFPDPRQLFEDCLCGKLEGTSPVERGRTAADFLVDSVRRVANRHPSIAWIFVTADVNSPGPGDSIGDPELDAFTVAVETFNARVLAACRDQTGWSVFSQDRVLRQYGSIALKDARLELLGRFPFSPAGGKILAERVAAHWAAIQGKMKKVLALDCDNTLWGGIVGEEGVQGVKLGPDGIGRAYTGFQKALLCLQARGTLLTLCSRNNPDDVREMLASRDDMAIRGEHLVAQSISWGRKSDGLKSLAQTLGLGMDSFVFVDDNPAEREEIRQALPEVTVPEFPSDPSDLPAFGYELGWRYFYRVALSDEDRRRTEQYRARAEIEVARTESPSPDEFLRSLKMTSRISVNSPNLIHRNAQLSQKTNQFNLTLRRYTEAEMAELTAAPDVLVISGSLADRFGDHGWVALAVVRLGRLEDCWRIDTLLMSCRVLGRGFEQEFAAQCIQRARSVHNLPIRAEYIQGPKNSQTASFYDGLGFSRRPSKSEEIQSYELPTEALAGSGDTHIDFTWE